MGDIGRPNHLTQYLSPTCLTRWFSYVYVLHLKGVEGGSNFWSMLPLPCIFTARPWGGKIHVHGGPTSADGWLWWGFSDLIRSSPPDFSICLYVCMSCLHTACFVDPSSNRCCHLTHVGCTHVGCTAVQLWSGVHSASQIMVSYAA